MHQEHSPSMRVPRGWFTPAAMEHLPARLGSEGMMQRLVAIALPALVAVGFGQAPMVTSHHGGAGVAEVVCVDAMRRVRSRVLILCLVRVRVCRCRLSGLPLRLRRRVRCGSWSSTTTRTERLARSPRRPIAKLVTVMRRTRDRSSASRRMLPRLPVASWPVQPFYVSGVCVAEAPWRDHDRRHRVVIGRVVRGGARAARGPGSSKPPSRVA